MNEFNAVIKSIETEDHISLVIAQAAGISFYTLVIDNQETADYLQEGKAVTLVFKENAVSLAKNLSGQLSIRNKLPCTITGMETGNVLSSVSLDCKGHKLVSVITTNAVKALNLQNGDHVEALIKTTDISLLQPES
jgi:molybdopterin-binding protein